MQPPDNCRRILCAVDTNPRDVHVIRWAADFGKERGAEVQLVHAIQGADPEQVDSAAFYAFLTGFAKHELAKMQTEAGTAFEVSVPSGTPAQVIHSAALEQQADLVVIGRGVLKNALGRLRSNAYSIIRDSPCPVIRVWSWLPPDTDFRTYMPDDNIHFGALMMWLERPFTRVLLVVSLTWAVIGGSAAFLLGVPQDLGLLGAAGGAFRTQQRGT